MDYFSHIKQKGAKWEGRALADHLFNVGTQAAAFGSTADVAWLRLAGYWHDLGKYHPAWQAYLHSATGYEPNAHIEQSGRPNHSSAGALYAIEALGPGLGHIMAYLIAGHHAGLPDWQPTEEGGKGSLSYRLQHEKDDYAAAYAMAQIHMQSLLPPQKLTPTVNKKDDFALWMRMLFSCLVDADYLDTEAFMDEGRAQGRGGWPDLSALQQRFAAYMAQFKQEKNHSPLAQLRNQIQQQCVQAAAQNCGIYSLTVPTGGGKTLSSLAFALEHARLHGKKRIVYAIPFTSIIEQTAQVFRQVLGEDVVLEHHSNMDVEAAHETARTRLAAENWDAPVIVTTNVQLFESLFAAKPGRCRKLHNLSDAVIVLDEAQQIPRDFHAPITHVMQQLQQQYGVTWLLCTATQPDFGKKTDALGDVVFKGLQVREVIPEPQALFNQMQRTHIVWPQDAKNPTPWTDIATRMRAEPAVLCIVNTRKSARQLFEALGEKAGHFHLSANMCAAHRSAVLKQIKQSLEAYHAGAGQAVRVVSTQLIEAGVDIDFPTVFRAIAGLDAIAQAAGRCNREGRLAQPGRVEVFVPEDKIPVGYLRQGASCTQELLSAGVLQAQLTPEDFTHYFAMMNQKGSRDAKGIMALLQAESSAAVPFKIQFRSAAEAFHLIENNDVSIVVPYYTNDAEKLSFEQLLYELEVEFNLKNVYKRLQKYIVTVSEQVFAQLYACGAVYELGGQFVLAEAFYHLYYGVITEPVLPPETTVL